MPLMLPFDRRCRLPSRRQLRATADAAQRIIKMFQLQYRADFASPRHAEADYSVSS